LVDVAVVVSRYFGGTKLGVGGLARAYSEAAVAVLNAAPKLVGTYALRNRIVYHYAQTAAVMRAIELFDAQAFEHGFADGPNEPEISFSLPRLRLEEMTSYLRDVSGGSLSIQSLGPVILYRPWTLLG
jgi:putative IMPACT (imprinted ancient) family translation regulator